MIILPSPVEPMQQVQGRQIGRTFLWAEISADGKTVDWYVTRKRDDNVLEYGSDPIPSGCSIDARQAVLEARMKLLIARYAPAKRRGA